MPDRRIHDWIGLSGVDPSESPRALIWSRRLEVPLLIIALWILVSWYWESSSNALPPSSLLNWCIWLFFLFETSLLTFLVNDKVNYLKSNWLNVVIILCGLPILWLGTPYAGILRSLRLLLFINLMLQLSATVRFILTRNHLGAMLLVSGIFVVVAGYLIAGIDPNINSPGDGIWWAWVTATTVGYGDIVPTSPEGRILGGILMALGVGLLSIITANISVYFIASAKNSPEKIMLERIEERLEKIEQLLQEKTSNQASTSPLRDDSKNS